ncbi:MAG: hypothetical protein EP297_07245 [Gammaproteobacteria bacterium]|nr:MAG: hypothetical protein EP297_07245 [Gammaproteobacteria bacterium]
MKHIGRLVFMLLFVWLYSTTVNAEQYLCVEEMAAGFTFKNGQWTPAKFRTDNRYIIRKRKPDDKVLYHQNPVYVVLSTGEEDVIGDCPNDFIYGSGLHCDMPTGEFKFSKRSGRFLKTYLMGYWFHDNDSDSDSDTPHIAIGKCSPL